VLFIGVARSGESKRGLEMTFDRQGSAREAVAAADGCLAPAAIHFLRFVGKEKFSPNLIIRTAALEFAGARQVLLPKGLTRCVQISADNVLGEHKKGAAVRLVECLQVNY
jgi:hypothetical protein